MLAERINKAWREKKESRIKSWGARSNAASQLGWKCDRYLYLRRKRGQEIPAHDVILQSVFDEGYLHEKAVKRELSDLGFEVLEAEREFRDEIREITCRIDGAFKEGPHRGETITVAELKSMSGNIFDRIHSIDDFIRSNAPYHRTYPAQLAMGMYFTEADAGVWILKNKTTGEIKCIDFPRGDLYQEILEDAIERAERITCYMNNKAITNDNLEDFIPEAEHGFLCVKCPFRGWACFPDIVDDAEVEILDDAGLEKALSDHADLQDNFDAYRRLDKSIKATAKKKEKEYLILGDFTIRVSSVEQRRLKPPKDADIPDEWYRVINSKRVTITRQNQEEDDD
jgi:hypothetical protein